MIVKFTWENKYYDEPNEIIYVEDRVIAWITHNNVTIVYLVGIKNEEDTFKIVKSIFPNLMLKHVISVFEVDRINIPNSTTIPTFLHSRLLNIPRFLS